MPSRYAQLSPLALAAGFGAAALVGMVAFVVPAGFSMFGMQGYGMMGGQRTMGGYGYNMGFGAALLVCVWVIIVSAIAGAVAAAAYNSFLSRRSS
jgi:uncharacterized membrane protein